MSWPARVVKFSIKNAIQQKENNMLQWTLWLLCLAYLIWRSTKTLSYLRKDSFAPSAVRGLLFLGFMWVALIGYGVRFYAALH